MPTWRPYQCEPLMSLITASFLIAKLPLKKQVIAQGLQLLRLLAGKGWQFYLLMALPAVEEDDANIKLVSTLI